jgi:hypothetical protein
VSGRGGALPATPVARQFRVAGHAHNDRQPHRGTHWHALPVLPGRTGQAAPDPYRAGAAAPPWCRPCARPGTHHATFVGARRASPAAPHGAAKQRYVPAPRDGHVTPAIDARRQCVCRLLRAGLTGPDGGQHLTPAEQGQEREGCGAGRSSTVGATPGRGCDRSSPPGAAPPTAQSITLLITSRKRDRSGPSRTR